MLVVFEHFKVFPFADNLLSGTIGVDIFYIISGFIMSINIEKYIDRQRDAIDVGANIGFQTVLMSKIISNRKVLAIEPTRNALIRLRRNLKLNAAEKNVIIFDGVASDVNETTSIKVLEGREEYSTLGVVSHPSVVGDSGSFTTERVQARTLDQLADDFNLDVGFIKVDAEGHEHKIFDGAKVLLTTQRPIVISELSDTLLRKNGSSALAVIRYFEALDYVVSDPLNAKATPGLRQFGDIVCVPSERQQS